MATHMAESRKAVRTYLRQQWKTMAETLENQNNFVEFEKALSFPYNQKLAYFPADTSLAVDSVATSRARGVFGKGSLIPLFTGEGNDVVDDFRQLAANQSAMLASLYARQEFIRAAARMPMTLFIGPDPTAPKAKSTGVESSPAAVEFVVPVKRTLLTSEKFSRVVFSGLKKGIEYVAVAELSRTYPQSAVVRVWWTGVVNAVNEKWVRDDMIGRWEQIAGVFEEPASPRILYQRGEHKTRGIPLFTKGLDNDATKSTYMVHAAERADMWANVIALTASDKHGDTNLWKEGAEKLWEGVGNDVNDANMEGQHWMAAMLALRRIPYIVKSGEKDHVNKDPLPHALTQGEAKTVEAMMSQIVKPRNQAASSPVNGKIGSRYWGGAGRRRVVFSEPEKWW